MSSFCDIYSLIRSDYAEENCYWFISENNFVCIDPGYGLDQKINQIISSNDNIKSITILITHAHHDHIAGIEGIVQRFPKSIIKIGENEEDFLYTKEGNLSYRRFEGFDLKNLKDHVLTIKNGEILKFGSVFLKAFQIEGHTPGSLMFVDEKNKIVFSGDNIKRGGYGLVDIPRSDKNLLLQNLKEFFRFIPDDYTILTGHGEPTTTGYEKANNAIYSISP